MERNGFDISFYQGRRVLITGHTGFKGSWMSVMLANAGAEVVGYSTCSEAEERLFDICGVESRVAHVKGDVRDLDRLQAVFEEHRPEVVVHMAAQPLVRKSYDDPVGTYSTNVMGTVNVLECARRSSCVRSVLNVTTDKVYENNEWEWGYREVDPLDGYDPYSNSKSCSELVTHAYARSFMHDAGIAVSTARAGNVIGGGDFSKDRIVPDCVRAVMSGKSVEVRNPGSVRPYQHVLEPLVAYLMIAASQMDDPSLAGWYNIGPDEGGCATTGELVGMMAEEWGDDFNWSASPGDGPHEAGLLKLDCSRARSVFGWRPKWDLRTAVAKTVEWTKCWASGGDARACMDRQIEEFLEG